jgi:hypothetical protein
MRVILAKARPTWPGLAPWRAGTSCFPVAPPPGGSILRRPAGPALPPPAPPARRKRKRCGGTPGLTARCLAHGQAPHVLLVCLALVFASAASCMLYEDGEAQTRLRSREKLSKWHDDVHVHQHCRFSSFARICFGVINCRRSVDRTCDLLNMLSGFGCCESGSFRPKPPSNNTRTLPLTA